MTHICVSKLTIIGSDNGLSPDRRQAIIWTNAGLLLNEPVGTNFSEIWIEIPTFLFKKMRLKVSSAKRRPFCLGLNVLTHWGRDKMADISQTMFSKAFSWMKSFVFWFQFHWSLFLRVQLTINKSALVQVMAWRPTADKPLLEPMLTQFNAAYMPQ